MRGRTSRDRVCAQLSSSHSPAGGSRRRGSAGVLCSLTRRVGFLVAGCRSAAGQCHSVQIDRDPAHQQAIAQPGTGSAVSRSRATARTLGQIACREKSAQRIGAAAFPVLGDLQEGYLRT
jgi:hypothetical protein